MQTTILKPSQKPKAKAKSQKPKAKSQKAKSQSQKQIRDVSSKMQQIACKSEILAPKCSKYQGKLPQTEKHKNIFKKKQKIL